MNEPAVGSVWKSRDPRDEGRSVKVASIENRGVERVVVVQGVESKRTALVKLRRWAKSYVVADKCGVPAK